MAQQTSEIIIRLKGDASGASRALGQTQRGLKGLSGQGKKAIGMANQFGSAMRYAMSPLVNMATGLRQVGQGLQSIAFLAATFISLPLVATLRAGAKTAIDYDDALIRVKKTTNLTEQELGRLSHASGTLNARLQELAKTISTPLTQLAELAEGAGQLGVRGVDNLMAYVRVAEIVGMTTDVEADRALSAFGRLARGMGVSAGEAGDFIIKLATTVNQLENTTTASASDIINAMQNMISVAATLGEDAAPSVVAFAATLYDLGVRSRVAGTMYNRMAQYIASNTADIASMMNTTVDEIRRRFDEDFTGSLLNLMKAIGQVESRTERMTIAEEIFGKRAGRGVTLLAENMEPLIKNLEEAHKEFHSGDSLIREYNEAMKSTEQQLGILRNNLQVAAVAMGKTFLPLINKAVAWLVPLIQKLADTFAALPEHIKLSALAAVLFAAIFGPLAIIFSTLIFAVSMITSGLVNMGIALATATVTVGNLLPALAALGAALLGLGKFAQRGVSRIGDVFMDAADAAESWGLGIVSSLAAGMLRGIAMVVNAAVRIANAIAGFFAASSPPEMGPLRKIAVWGKKLIETYIKGFAAADFSIVEDVTDRIANYFRSMARAGWFDEKEVVPAILEVRHEFVKLLHTFEETGRISEEVLGNIRDRMGEAGNRVAKYLELQLKVNAAQKEYNDASRRLEEISRLRKEITETYEREVKAIESSGKPVLEQMRMVGRARRERDGSLDALDDEQALARDARDEAGENLDIQRELLETQEGLIDYYQTELDLLVDQKEALEDVGKAAGAGGAAGDIDEFAGALAGVGEVDFDPMIEGVGSTLEELLSRIETIPDEMRRARRVIDAFFAGLAGEYYEVEVVPGVAHGFDPGVEGMGKAWELGMKIHEIFGKLTTAVETLTTAIRGEGGLTESIKNLTADDALGWFEAHPNIAGLIAGVGAGFVTYKGLPIIASAMETFVLWLMLLPEGASGVISGIGAALAGLITPALGAAIAVGILVWAWTTNMGGFRDTMIKTFGDIKKAVVSFPDSMKVAWENTKEYANNLKRDALKAFLRLKIQARLTFQRFKREATRIWESFKDDVLKPLREMAGGLLEDWNEMTGGMLEGFQELWKEIKPVAEDLKDFFVDDVWGPIEGAIDGVKGAIGDVIGGIKELARKARNLSIPDWMIPHSPSPLEIGLRGIANALGDVSVQMGDFEMPKGLPAAQGGFAFAGGGQVVIEKVQLGERVVIPNMSVGRAMVNQLMDEMGKATRVRRTKA